MWETILEYLYIIPAAALAISLHEMSHGYMSYFLGDPTPKEQGRLSLNPIRHFDLVGFICLVLFRLGFAKPVRVNPYHYKNPKLGIALVALAGPLMNFIISTVSFFIFVVLLRFSDFKIIEIISNFLLYLGVLNLGLGLFNLIPIPPLDGSRILGAILPNETYRKYMSYEKYGFFILLGLMILSDILGEITGVGSLFSEIIFKIYSWIINVFMKIVY